MTGWVDVAVGGGVVPRAWLGHGGLVDRAGATVSNWVYVLPSVVTFLVGWGVGVWVARHSHE